MLFWSSSLDPDSERTKSGKLFLLASDINRKRRSSCSAWSSLLLPRSNLSSPSSVETLYNGRIKDHLMVRLVALFCLPGHVDAPEGDALLSNAKPKLLLFLLLVFQFLGIFFRRYIHPNQKGGSIAWTWIGSTISWWRRPSPDPWRWCIDRNISLTKTFSLKSGRGKYFLTGSANSMTCTCSNWNPTNSKFSSCWISSTGIGSSTGSSGSPKIEMTWFPCMNLTFWCKVEGTASMAWIHGLPSSRLKEAGMSSTWNFSLNRTVPALNSKAGDAHYLPPCVVICSNGLP